MFVDCAQHRRDVYSGDGAQAKAKVGYPNGSRSLWAGACALRNKACMLADLKETGNDQVQYCGVG